MSCSHIRSTINHVVSVFFFLFCVSLIVSDFISERQMNLSDVRKEDETVGVFKTWTGVEVMSMLFSHHYLKKTNDVQLVPCN